MAVKDARILLLPIGLMDLSLLYVLSWGVPGCTEKVPAELKPITLRVEKIDSIQTAKYYSYLYFDSLSSSSSDTLSLYTRADSSLGYILYGQNGIHNTLKELDSIHKKACELISDSSSVQMKEFDSKFEPVKVKGRGYKNRLLGEVDFWHRAGGNCPERRNNPPRQIKKTTNQRVHVH